MSMLMMMPTENSQVLELVDTAGVKEVSMETMSNRGTEIAMRGEEAIGTEKGQVVESIEGTGEMEEVAVASDFHPWTSPWSQERSLRATKA